MKLREIRKRRRLTQMELARRAGLDQSQISKIERGLINPSLRTVVHLARILDVTLDELAGELVNDEAA